MILSSVASLLIAADMSRTLSMKLRLAFGGLAMVRREETDIALFPAGDTSGEPDFARPHVVWPFGTHSLPLREIDGLSRPSGREFRADTYFGLGKDMASTGNRAGALWGYEMAFGSTSTFADAYIGRAAIRLEQGNIDEALAGFRYRLATEPGPSRRACSCGSLGPSFTW